MTKNDMIKNILTFIEQNRDMILKSGIKVNMIDVPDYTKFKNEDVEKAMRWLDAVLSGPVAKTARRIWFSQDPSLWAKYEDNSDMPEYKMLMEALTQLRKVFMDKDRPLIFRIGARNEYYKKLEKTKQAEKRAKIIS